MTKYRRLATPPQLLPHAHNMRLTHTNVTCVAAVIFVFGLGTTNYIHGKAEAVVTTKKEVKETYGSPLARLANAPFPEHEGRGR